MQPELGTASLTPLIGYALCSAEERCNLADCLQTQARSNAGADAVHATTLKQEGWSGAARLSVTQGPVSGACYPGTPSSAPIRGHSLIDVSLTD